MRKCILSLLLLSVSLLSQGQNWNEWFRQKRTQLRYHLRQIAALRVYIELGQKGYGIYRDGLQLIGDIKDGDLNLHKDYFASLSNVNQHISNSPNVDEILLWHGQVVIFKNRIDQMQLGVVQGSLDNMFAGLVGKSRDHLGQLELLITSGNYQLTDTERIEQINALHAEQQRIYAFAKSTYQEAVVYDKQQNKGEHEIKVIQQLQGLP